MKNKKTQVKQVNSTVKSLDTLAQALPWLPINLPKESKDRTYVYVIKDLSTLQNLYVGSTNEPRTRAAQHFAAAIGRPHPRQKELGKQLSTALNLNFDFELPDLSCNTAQLANLCIVFAAIPRACERYTLENEVIAKLEPTFNRTGK